MASDPPGFPRNRIPEFDEGCEVANVRLYEAFSVKVVFTCVA